MSEKSYESLPVTAYFWVGTYTLPMGAGDGIYLISKRAGGDLCLHGLAARLDSPSYLLAHPQQPVLYAISEGSDELTVFDTTNPRRLQAVTRVAVPAGPCHIAFARNSSALLISSYKTGSISAQPITASGHPEGKQSRITGTGSGPHPIRQRSPHAHATAVHPSGVIIGTDLGADACRLMRFHRGRLELVSSAALPTGCGPRHLVIHPTGSILVITELGQSVLGLRLTSNRADLELQAQSPVTSQPPDNGDLPAAIALARNGTLAYTSTRGSDVITTHSVDPDGLHLSPQADVSSGGTWPRDLLVSTATLLVANQRSGTLTAFEPDPTTGVPRQYGRPLHIPGAAHVCAVPRC
ncbi:lactonase family protein [Mycolicibacterium cosmeticum]|uniref:lactonase family protein n=1 Tax=Mycolicibacterium cosmeticum TaxID=258533 RepID=UPI003D161A41